MSSNNPFEAGPSPTSITATSNASSTGDRNESNKRLKVNRMASVLTYEVSGSGVSVQVLSTNTYHDLVDVVCRETCVGLNEDVYDHMWNVTDMHNGKQYESGDWPSGKRASQHSLGSDPGPQLVIEYDYGSTSYINLNLKAIKELSADVDQSCFPRRAPLPGQETFQPFQPGPDAANMDELYPSLSKFLFKKDNQEKVEINLFQPGKKKVHAYIENGYFGCLHAMYVPEKFSCVEEMLFALNKSSQVDRPEWNDTEYGSFPSYNWYGITIFPPSKASSPAYNRYRSRDSPGLCETTVRGFNANEKGSTYENKFLSTFPKCALAAGFNQKGKPSKAHERGYIVYRNGTLMVCRGNTKTIKSNAPSPGVFDGNNKHEPMSEADIIGKINIEINSLQELFCAAEALW